MNKASWNDMERPVGVVDGVAVAFPMGAICSTSTYDNLLFESVDLGRQCGCIGYGLCAYGVLYGIRITMYIRSTGVRTLGNVTCCTPYLNP